MLYECALQDHHSLEILSRIEERRLRSEAKQNEQAAREKELEGQIAAALAQVVAAVPSETDAAKTVWLQYAQHCALRSSAVSRTRDGTLRRRCIDGTAMRETASCEFDRVISAAVREGGSALETIVLDMMQAAGVIQ